MTLEDLGFLLVETGECFWRYEHEEEDHRIDLYEDKEGLSIYSTTITVHRDFNNLPYREAFCITLDEIQACMNTIERLSKTIK